MEHPVQCDLRNPLARFARVLFFFFNDTATTEIYTLSLHDALPISTAAARTARRVGSSWPSPRPLTTDRKSTGLNSSHSQRSYAVYCLKKKKNSPYLLCLQRITNQPMHDYSSPEIH